MNEVDIIKGAREILSDPRHWCKGGYTDGKECYCILGAMSMAAHGNPYAFGVEYQTTLARAAEMVAQHTPFDPSAYTAATFNDDPITTHQDILNILDKTLADLGAL